MTKPHVIRLLLLLPTALLMLMSFSIFLSLTGLRSTTGPAIGDSDFVAGIMLLGRLGTSHLAIGDSDLVARIKSQGLSLNAGLLERDR